jgi:chromate transporter
VLFVLPSLLILSGLSWVYLRWGEQPMVSAVLDGVKPAVVAIVLAAAWRLGTRALRHRAHWAVAVAALLSVAVFDVPFPAVILSAAVVGMAIGRLWPSATGGASHGPSRADAAPRCVIDDADPPPPHAIFRLKRTVVTVLVFVAIWASCLAILAATRSLLGDTALQLAWFHTKAALLTFGGAYAVLPYVYQAAVEHYQWLSAAQMIDGLALGETTPGPLIMVVAYVGFLAGWLRQMLGPDALFAAGALGASIATLFTFLPSFLFILVGGPFIEGTRQQIRLQAPLTGITAAVVGVIVSLALFFARHVLLTESGGVDWLAVAIACASLVALTRLRRGVVEVIVAAGLAGLAAKMLL